MKRSFSLLLFFLLSITSLYAFDITNEAGQEKTFFSVNDPKVEVISENNFQNFTVTYTLLNATKQDVFDLSPCSSKFCGSFLLTNLIQNLNDTFVGSKTFTISVGPINQTIFFDLENPVFTLKDLEINSEEKKVELEFSVSDNSGIVQSLELFKEVGTTRTFLANLTGKTKFNVTLQNAEDFTLIFKAKDVAGNVQEHEEEVNVTDIFDPIITKTLLIRNDDNSFSLEFKATDDNLSTYSITQGSLSLSETISGTSVSKTITLPFTGGSVVLKVTDKEGNNASKTIKLEDKTIELTNLITYSNKKVYSFNAQASFCTLLGVDKEDVEKNFSKSDTKFELTLGLTNQGEHLINFTCEDSSTRVFFSKSFVYDTEKPSTFDLSAQATEDGTITLNWTKSSDELSGPVTYQIFREDDKEAEQKDDLDFEDDEVKYPNEYEYFIRALDKAGNSVDSTTVKISPIKVAVKLDTNFNFKETVKEAKQTLKIFSEEDATIILLHTYKGETLLSKTFNAIDDELLEVELTLKEGENKISIKAEDNEGNKKERTLLLTLEEGLVNTITTSTNDGSLSSGKTNESDVEILAQEERRSFWSYAIWIFLFLVILALFIWIFILNEERLKGRRTQDDEEERNWKKKHKTRKNSLEFLGSFGSGKDHYLEKDLKRIKRERIKKQEEEKERKERELRRREREAQESKSELQKQKLNDLASRRELQIPLSQREKAKKRVERIEKEMGESSFEREEKRKNKKEEKREDPLLSYLNNAKLKRSWDSVTSYRQKREERVEEEKVEKVIEESKKKETLAEIKKEKIEEPIEEKQERKKVERPSFGLDEYLNKRVKKRRWYFLERDVERDISSRRNNE